MYYYFITENVSLKLDLIQYLNLWDTAFYLFA